MVNTIDGKHKPQEYNFSSYTETERKNYTEKCLEHGYLSQKPSDLSELGFIGQILFLDINNAQQSIDETSRQSDSMSTSRENHIYYTKMKIIPKVTINLHGKLELSEQAKVVLRKDNFG